MKKQKTSLSYKIFSIVNGLVMLTVIMITILPYLHVLAKALNDGIDTMRGGITIFPRKPTFENFKVLLSDKTITNAAFISFSRVIIGTILGVIVQFSGAYALTKNVRGRKAALLFLIIPMFFTSGIIPTYLLYAKVGLNNTYWVYILPTLATYYNVLIVKSYIESSVPVSLGEAAMLDGAGEFTILWRIIFPMCKPVIATISLWIAVYHWNDWTSTLYYVTKEKLFPLQYNLMQLIKESERIKSMLSEAARSGGTETFNIKATPEALVSAQVIFTTIPIVIVYPFVQKYFVQGITLGAVKG